ncbi:MAG TPA: hypothetical protein VIE67_01935 [Rudaea sp.]|jgi:hypothetical protein|uniref:hypothetical protein n=1 Tax=Rudaea sp. TaxID=2136325 RepID=UPI002F95F0A2
MNTRMMVATMSVALGVAGSVFATHASACSVSALRAAAEPGSAAALAAAQFKAATLGNVASAQQNNSGNAHGSIVGFWRFAFTAYDGVTSLDWGFQQWHSDGTELTNSGGHPAVGGNFCMGVWEQKGGGAYSLNHWAIAWGAAPPFDPLVLTGLVHIRETVTVDKTGNSMTGFVTQDLYAADGITLLAPDIGDGTVSATRITPTSLP